MEKASIHTYVRNMMALPFLPAADIEPAFQLLALRANSEQLSRFVHFIEEQLINHAIFDIDSLSVYGVSVRTNNDTEGWHQSLNRKQCSRCCQTLSPMAIILSNWLLFLKIV
ncbi:hypothetical protein DPMN_124756 [Dreissena polymorpha]|uniref:Uncharacterized protein n=1 Tax=Dreissena polymorpha TaxID=45954 RepID=A0A9D4H032_DREPO|nr:hypothetical protein DPMN_124756 [Dreissena polymorpha]